MNILVCVKQVPDTAKVKLDPQTNRLQRAGVPNILNPFDEHAVEAALALRDEFGGRVTVLSMGPPQAADALRECLARGVDAAYLLSDRAFGGADTLATAYTLSTGIRHLGEFDLILCGKQAIDGDTAQVGSQIAEMLDIPQVSAAVKLSVKDGEATVVREHEDGYETLRVALPALITATKNLNTPRYPSIRGLLASRTAEIPILGAADIGADPERIGMKGSPTQVRRTRTPQARKQGMIIRDRAAAEAVAEFFAAWRGEDVQEGGRAE